MLTLDHVVFPVRDAATTVRFYTEVLRLPLVSAFSGDDWGGYPWLMMIFGLGVRNELVTVALKGAPAPDYAGLPSDVRHYALAAESAEAFADWRARIRTAGLAAWEETHGDRQSIYFPDPDGVILEITWPPAQVPEQADEHAHDAVKRWTSAAP